MTPAIAAWIYENQRQQIADLWHVVLEGGCCEACRAGNTGDCDVNPFARPVTVPEALHELSALGQIP